MKIMIATGEAVGLGQGIINDIHMPCCLFVGTSFNKVLFYYISKKRVKFL